MSLRLAIPALAALALLAGCGGADDASEDAVADTVEQPADEALADTPMPVEDNDLVETEPEARPVREAPSMDQVERSAERAADEAQSAVDDAIAAAESEME